MKSLFYHGKSRAFAKIGVIAFSFYFAIILGFAVLYYKADSISSKTHNSITCSQNFDNVYFSFVAFHTIGFGDFSPQNYTGKILLWIEAILSLLFHTLFSGYIIWVLIKRFPEVVVSDFILLGPNDSGHQSLSIRFANKGSNILDAQASLDVYTFKETSNRQPRVIRFQKSISYHCVLEKSSLLFRFDLQTATTSHLKTLIVDSINNLNLKDKKSYVDVIQLVFSFKGVDEITGDFIGVSNIFTEQHFKFGDCFDKVVEWNGINPEKKKKPKWENLNSIINETTFENFLNT
jgi:hypothetical protein